MNKTSKISLNKHEYVHKVQKQNYIQERVFNKEIKLQVS